ncbi:hypothetical protein ACI3RH_04935 [Lactococcus lactis]
MLGNIIVVSGAFIILLVLLRLFAWNAITSVFASRAKKISDDIDAADTTMMLPRTVFGAASNNNVDNFYSFLNVLL